MPDTFLTHGNFDFYSKLLYLFCIRSHLLCPSRGATTHLNPSFVVGFCFFTTSYKTYRCVPFDISDTLLSRFWQAKMLDRYDKIYIC